MPKGPLVGKGSSSLGGFYLKLEQPFLKWLHRPKKERKKKVTDNFSTGEKDSHMYFFLKSRCHSLNKQTATHANINRNK